ncbi:MAG: thioredoxin family protein [Bdellovibrionaceae bacterium]|nr:thioredoxin family protein [Pseudobdellovibrionaceae bacterium]
MKVFLFLSFLMMGTVSFASSEAVPGKPAPAFETKDATGKVHKLADYKDKWVVLEWYNKDCPYVKKHYGSNNMQALQKTYTDKGVVWLSVNSSAKGKEGYTDAAAALRVAKDAKSNATAVLLDEKGIMGKAFGSKTTPHMFVIDPHGVVVYAGAIDDNDSSDPAIILQSKNYVAMALDAAMAGKKVEKTSTKPYGCSTKY